MEVKNNFYGFCKEQTLCSDPENSAVCYPPAAIRQIKNVYVRSWTGWREKGLGERNAQPLFPHVPVSRCLLLAILAINKWLYKTFFSECLHQFLNFFPLIFFSNPCQAPFLRINQEILHRQFFSEKVKCRHVGSYFGYLEAKVLKLQERRGRTSF